MPHCNRATRLGGAIPAPKDPNVHRFSELCALPNATSASRLAEQSSIQAYKHISYCQIEDAEAGVHPCDFQCIMNEIRIREHIYSYLIAKLKVVKLVYIRATSSIMNEISSYLIIKLNVLKVRKLSGGLYTMTVDIRAVASKLAPSGDSPSQCRLR
ncbi:jg3491 [Pararge aegeria aegeria]|uniref:Jg3491 protein n=1 Tax=Pararge aegeria aegeria TaxID=348720 RepID=A0A8S4SFV1_9NEOP|nr:jg3491 [Pararge aegeria aegeria]